MLRVVSLSSFAVMFILYCTGCKVIIIIMIIIIIIIIIILIILIIIIKKSMCQSL